MRLRFGPSRWAACWFAAAILLLPGPTIAQSEQSASADAEEFPVKFGGPFTLVDHEGITRTDADFRGRFMLVYFGYTYCPDICPTGLQTMTDALDMLGAAVKRVQPLFISIDPARDTVPELKQYLENFQPAILGLTGSEAQVRAVARAYKVHRRKVNLSEPEDANDYLVDHSSITYLMGPDGGFVTLFPHGTEPEFMADAIRRYLEAG